VSEVIKGFAKKIGIKEGRGKRGPWKLYSVKIELEDGSEHDSWISLGFDAPSFKEGDYVKIEASENDRGYLQADKVTKLKNPPAKSSKGAAAPSGGHVTSTQTSIHYQSARKDAIEVLKLLQSQDALPLSTAKTKAGEAKRYEEVMALVAKLTVEFFNDAETHRLLKTVADAGKVDTDAGELPEDDEDDSEAEESYADEEESDDE
jgi:hypothetical protein